MKSLKTIAGSFLILTLATNIGFSDSSKRLINGTPVAAGEYPSVIRINDKCTATVVGPRTIVTAAHCGQNGTTASFSVGGQNFSAKIIRSSLYPSREHDIAVGITNMDIPISPVSIETNSNTATKGLGITLLGYGCTQVGGGGGNDGILRKGENVIVNFSNYYMVSYNPPSGAALCFGDSGGPVFIEKNGKPWLLGIHAKGNIKDTNYDTRTDMADSKSFLENVASSQGVQICGVNKDCEGGTPGPAPTCSLASSSSEINLGDAVTFYLSTQGQISSATINQQPVLFPNGSLTVTPQVAGPYQANAKVSGPDGSGTCSASVTVKSSGPPPGTKPTCTISANPSAISLGQSITLNLQTQGEVTEATINGTKVSPPVGSVQITPLAKGTHSAWGTVMGPQGNGSCRTSYTVSEDAPPPPPAPGVPLLTVVPTYCGYNTLGETNVWRVCLAVLKHDASMVDMRFTDVVMITYRDTTREVMPVIHTKQKSKAPTQLVNELTMYANNTVTEGQKILLDHRTAQLKIQLDGSKSTPIAVQGRASNGQYFIVDQLSQYDGQ